MKKGSKLCAYCGEKQAEYQCSCDLILCKNCSEGGCECPEDYPQHNIEKLLPTTKTKP